VLRNESLKRAAVCDWMIFVDGHEFLEPASAEPLEHILGTQSPNTEAVMVTVKHGGREFLYSRMMRTDRALKFSGVFHNDLHFDTDKALSAPSLALIHDRPGKITEQRAKQVETMNTFYFGALADENPDDRRALFYYASALYGADRQDEAIPVWEKYVASVETAAEYGSVFYDPQRYQASIYLARHYLRVGDMPRAWDMAMGCWRCDVSRNEHVILLADIAVQRDDHVEAAHWYRLATHYRRPTSMMFSYEESYGSRPFLALAQQYAHLGELESCEACINKVMTMEAEQQQSEPFQMAQQMLTALWRAKRGAA